VASKPSFASWVTRRLALRALLAQLEGLAARQPVLAVFEDIHWIDPTSLELLDLTVNQVPTTPVLLIITFRPEFAPRGPAARTRRCSRSIACRLPSVLR
jgi:predicted ATPase